MASCRTLCAYCVASVSIITLFSGCTSPFDSRSHAPLHQLTILDGSSSLPRSIFREQSNNDNLPMGLDSSPESFIRYALFHSPDVERAYQQWRVASERLPQVASLPDPRLNIGFFLNEVETRVGPQQARIGIEQTFPWLGKLRDRQDAASMGALAAWAMYHNAQLIAAEQVMHGLYELAYLDSAIQITQENRSLLKTIEEVVRARYRVGAQTQPELLKVQVELVQVDDRVLQLESLRPSYVAAVNTALNRAPDVEIYNDVKLDYSLASQDTSELISMAHESSPVLESMRQRVEQQRILNSVAKKNGYPDITVGIDYIVTDEASDPSIAESGDDPIMLSVGINLPIWREKYDAGVRESIAQRLTLSRSRDAMSSIIDTQIYQTQFAHTDAARRFRLYEESLIPKAQDSLAASLASFRTGDSSFIDMLDTQRTLLEFTLSGQRAKADQGKALSTLNRIIGNAVRTTESSSIEAQP